MITQLKSNANGMTIEIDKCLVDSLGVTEGIELDAKVIEGVLMSLMLRTN